MIQRLTVALAQNLPQPLSYQADHPHPILPGQRVLVPLGRRVCPAWVVEPESGYSGRLRAIVALFDDPFTFPTSFLQSIFAMSRTYLQSQGQLLEAALPQDLKAGKGLEYELEGAWVRWDGLSPLPKSEKGTGLLRCRTSGAHRFESLRQSGPELLSGGSYQGPLQITGADRFAKLVDLAEGIRAAGGSLLTLAGDAQTIKELAAQLPNLRAYHSQIPVKEKRSIWHAAMSGEPQWIIGGVSAAMLPIRNLAALLIIDAENPGHFSRFHRDYGPVHLARLRSANEGIPLICSSPAPTLLSTWLSSGLKEPQSVHNELSAQARVIPARWGRPEALERLGRSLLEGHDPSKRTLYVTAQAEAVTAAWCPACKHRQIPALDLCPDCQGPTQALPRPTGLWLTEVFKRRIEPQFMTMLDKKGSVDLKGKLIMTPAALVSKAGGGYDRIVLIGPESWISLDEIDGALRLWAFVDSMRERLLPDGEILVYSAYHFHYALKLANDAAAFFEREINYRRWFKLPPLYAVYQVDFREKNIRALARSMRSWTMYFKHDEDVRIEQVRLINRIPQRGLVRGSFVFHGQSEKIWQSGLFPKLNTGISLLMA